MKKNPDRFAVGEIVRFKNIDFAKNHSEWMIGEVITETRTYNGELKTVVEGQQGDGPYVLAKGMILREEDMSHFKVAFYKDGAELISSDIVTGEPYEEGMRIINKLWSQIQDQIDKLLTEARVAQLQQRKKKKLSGMTLRPEEFIDGDLIDYADDDSLPF